MGLHEEEGTCLCLTVLPEREQRPLLVLHQSGRQLHRQPDDQHPQRGVQQEVHQVPFEGRITVRQRESLGRRGGGHRGLAMNLQRARVLLGERGQEDVGKVDEKGADGLLGRVKKPGREQTGPVGSISF